MATDNIFKIKVKFEEEEGAFNNIKKAVSDLFEKQKDLPVSAENLNKALILQKTNVKNISVTIDDLKDKLKSIYQEAKIANSETSDAFQKQEKLLERRLHLRQKEYVEAQKIQNTIEAAAKIQQQTSKTTSSNFAQSAINKGESAISGAASSVVGGGLGSMVGKTVAGGLAALGTGGIVALVAAAATYLLKATVDYGWNESKRARQFITNSQDMSYRYKLSQDLSQYATKTIDRAHPEETGYMNAEQLSNELYPALGKTTGNMYLEKGLDLTKNIAKTTHEQGFSVDEMAQILALGKEAGFTSPYNSKNELTTNTVTAENTLINALNAAVSQGMDKSTRMEQLVKLTQYAYKDLATIQKDVGKNIISQLRTLENMNIPGLLPEKAAEAVTSQKDMVGNIQLPVMAQILQENKNLNDRATKAAISTMAEYYQGPGVTDKEAQDKAKQQFYSPGNGPLLQIKEKEIEIKKNPELTRIFEQQLKTKHPEAMPFIEGLNEKSSDMDVEQYNLRQAILNQPKRYNKAREEALSEQQKKPDTQGVNKNPEALAVKGTEFLEAEKDLMKSTVALAAARDAMTWMLQKEIFMLKESDSYLKNLLGDKDNTKRDWSKEPENRGETAARKTKDLWDIFKPTSDKETDKESFDRQWNAFKDLFTSKYNPQEGINPVQNGDNTNNNNSGFGLDWITNLMHLNSPNSPIHLPSTDRQKNETQPSNKYNLPKTNLPISQRESGNSDKGILNTLKGWGKDLINLIPSINSEAQAADIPPELLASVAHNESGGKANAVSEKGAKGVMQLMPGTAKALNVKNPFDPIESLRGGAKYLRDLLHIYKGSDEAEARTISAYNMGPGNLNQFIKKYGSVENSRGGFVDYKDKQNKRHFVRFEDETGPYLDRIKRDMSKIRNDGGLFTRQAIKNNKPVTDTPISNTFFNRKNSTDNTIKEKVTPILIKNQVSSDQKRIVTPILIKNQVSSDQKRIVTPSRKDSSVISKSIETNKNNLNPKVLKDKEKEVINNNKEHKIEKLIPVKELKQKQVEPYLKNKEQSAKQINSVIEKVSKEKESIIEKTILQSENSNINTTPRYVDSGGVKINTLHVDVPGINISQRGKDQMKAMFEHELVLSPSSSGRN